MWKKSLRLNKKAKTKIILLSFLLILLLAFLVYGKEYYVGDIVKLDLRGFGEYTANIITPDGQYLQKSNNSLLVLELTKEGNYSVSVKSSNRKQDIDFEVKPQDYPKEIVYYNIDEVNSTPLEIASIENVSVEPLKNESENVSDSILQESDYNLELNQTEIRDETLNLVDNSTEIQNLDEQIVSSGRIIVGKNVTWIKKERNIGGGTFSVDIPESSGDIKIYGDNKTKYEVSKSLIRSALNLFSDYPNKTLLVDNVSGEVTIEYTTPAPEKREREISEHKREVVVYTDKEYGYKNVLASTNFNNDIKNENYKTIRIYWKENNTYLPFKTFDKDNDGFIDKVEWNVEHLSTQTFEIIVITKASHLDSNKEFIEDIYDSVKELDGNWSPVINDSEYVRVVFEKNLTSDNDITIYPNITSGNPVIEVYVTGTDTKVAQFDNMLSNGYNKIFLRDLNGTSDSFDLKILNGTIQFDYIVDPSGFVTNVQRGTTAMTATTLDITINTVNQSSAFILLSTMSASDTPNILQVTASFLNDTTLRLQKNSATSTTVSWEVVESPNFNVQRNEVTTPATTTANMDIDLPTNVNTSKSFIILTNRINTATAANNVRGFWSGSFVNASRFNVSRGVTGTSAVLSWQVVEWGGAEVQSRVVNATNTPVVIDLNKTINLSQSFIYVTRSSTTTSAIDTMARVYFVNASRVAVDRVGTTGNTTVGFFVVSSPQLMVQSDFDSFSATTVQSNTINLVNYSSTFTLGSNNYGTANTNFGRAAVMANLSNATNFTLQKLGGTTTVNVSWFVVNFTTDSLAPQYNSITTNSSSVSPNDAVLFSANWTDDIGLSSWIFYWDVGNGFEPAGSGNFNGGFNETSSIGKTIPSSAEGTTLNYYFRAYDLSGQNNQTSGNDNISVRDVTAPTIISSSINKSEASYGEILGLQANVTDNFNVNLTWARIGVPGNSYTNISMNYNGSVWLLDYLSSNIGRYNFTIFSNDSSNNTGSGSTGFWNITGFSKVNLTYPLSGNFNFGNFLNIQCDVKDTNTSLGIQNYPVNFYEAGILIGTNSTNSSGIAIYNWSVNNSGIITLNCTISNNQTLFYNTSNSNSNSSIDVLTPSIVAILFTHENNITNSVNEYEIKDNLSYVNVTVKNVGRSNSSSVNVTLNLLYPNGTIIPWFNTITKTCGSLANGSSCQLKFDNSSRGYNLSGVTSGVYQLNATTNWTNGGNSPVTNTSNLTIYYVLENITGAFSDSEISSGVNTTYLFNITNPWSKNITSINVTINCPTVLGLRCFYNNSGNLNYSLGNLSSGNLTSKFFNITTNSSTPSGAYNINITVKYTNPGNETIIWTQVYNAILNVRPLLAVIQSYPLNVTRSTAFSLAGYGKNIGTGNLTNVNLTYSYPFAWINTTGARINTTANLIPDQLFWNNITVNVNMTAALGTKQLYLGANSPNASLNNVSVNIDVYANTSMNLTINNTSPLRLTQVLIKATLRMDNGTFINNANITFQSNYSNTTNATGDAFLYYFIPANANIGTNNFTVNISHRVNTTMFYLNSVNTTNISVSDQILINQTTFPTLEGLGRNVTIESNVSGLLPIDKVFANVTNPSGTKYFLPMSLVSGQTYRVNFTSPWISGVYNYTIFVNNTMGFSNETTVKGNFTIANNITIVANTLSSFYIPNQVVNLSADKDEIVVRLNNQRGTVVMAATTQDVTINPVNQSRAFILISTMSASNTPDILQVTATFLNDTTLRLQKNSATATTVIWEVVEGSNLRVQRGEVLTGATTTATLPVTLDSPVDLSESFIIVTNRINTATAANTVRGFWSAAFDDSSSFTMTRGTTGTLSTASWQVVEWTGASVASGTVTATNTPTLVDLPANLNLSQSFIYITKSSSGSNAVDTMAKAFFFNSTQMAVSRIGTTGTTTVSYFIINSTQINVQRGFNSFSATTVQSNALTAVNTSASFTTSSNDFATASTNYGRAFITTNLTNSTNLDLQKLGGTNTANASWFVVNFVGDDSQVIWSSKSNNTGSTNFNGYLLMTVENNNTGSWTNVATILNDSLTGTLRSYSFLTAYNLSNFWNDLGGWNTNSGVGGGNYRARVSLTDSSGNTLQTSNGTNYTTYAYFDIDFNPPTVILTYPDNMTTTFGLTATVNYSATDPSGVINCSLYHNKSGLFTLEQTKDHDAGVNNTFIITGFTQNTFIKWNVRCTDGAGNTGFTATDGFFTQIVPPDFTLNNTDIVLSNTSRIIEGNNVTINATISNYGGQTGTANVSFYNGNPSAGGVLIGNTSVFVGIGLTNISRINWSAVIGPNIIYVVLDPPIATNGSVVEINESNNIANMTFNIPSWQEFYGNASIRYLLAKSDKTNISNWGNSTGLNGNIFIADQESTIEWLSLKAIGKNTTGQNSTNDFAEIDTSINTTNYVDSVSTLYSNSQVPKTLSTFTIHDQNISFVPVINSTNTTNFITGIVWDSSDDSNGEYDSVNKEDLVFVTKMNKQKNGYYGKYDYEINIPVRLRNYKTTDQTKVYLYFDLN